MTNKQLYNKNRDFEMSVTQLFKAAPPSAREEKTQEQTHAANFPERLTTSCQRCPCCPTGMLGNISATHTNTHEHTLTLHTSPESRILQVVACQAPARSPLIGTLIRGLVSLSPGLPCVTLLNS